MFDILVLFQTEVGPKRELDESALCQIGPRQIGPLKKSALGKSAPKSETSRKKTTITYIYLHSTVRSTKLEKNKYHIYLFTVNTLKITK